jgi:hypothetical protein
MNKLIKAVRVTWSNHRWLGHNEIVLADNSVVWRPAESINASLAWAAERGMVPCKALREALGLNDTEI